MGSILQKISPRIVIIFLLFFIFSELIFISFKSGVITVRVNSQKNDIQIRKQVQSVSTSSADINSEKSEEDVNQIDKVASGIPQGKPGEMTVSCVVDPNCGGGEKILPLSVCENSPCCLENGTYVQHWDRKSCSEVGHNNAYEENNNQQNNVYVPVFIDGSEPQISAAIHVPIYLEAYGTTYNCNQNAVERIKSADSDYMRELKEVAEICARSDASNYAYCLNSCTKNEDFNTCDKKCYEESYGRCDINPVDSPEYRQLEFVMEMYCK